VRKLKKSHEIRGKVLTARRRDRGGERKSPRGGRLSLGETRQEETKREKNRQRGREMVVAKEKEENQCVKRHLKPFKPAERKRGLVGRMWEEGVKS